LSFSRELDRRQNDPDGRRWLFVPYDQLSDSIGPLAREDPAELGIIVIENLWVASHRPYHKQKLALLFSNLRHFALEQAARGVAVRHVVARGSYRSVLEPLVRELGKSGPVRVMAPAERELRADLRALIDAGALESIPHEGWLTTRDQFERIRKKRSAGWRMDSFYRLVRRETGFLMEGGKPVGGKLSFDADNRQAWPGDPPAPTPPRFELDPIKEGVGELVERLFSHHPGTLDLSTLPATRYDADTLWTWAQRECLRFFGPYEDAMSTRSTSLFHTRLSALMNLHRILPRRVVEETLDLDLPLASKEGFVRQVLGWREFVRHVHEATDGFRELPSVRSPIATVPGDGGYAGWAGKDWTPSRPDAGAELPIDGGAAPSFLGADRPLPPAFWGNESGLECLDRVVEAVWSEGYSHHITRLMVLSNLATLLDVTPRELTDWFWVAYTDAHDWVVEPNVLGMGTFALGELMTTKPYVSGAAYIDRMSDFCADCAFDPKSDCPITRLYWAFLARHRRRLEANPRLRMPLASLKRRTPEKRRGDREVYERVREQLARGDRLEPDHA
jgi:deoxyribodipyrimidine photolyase-related protein